MAAPRKVITPPVEARARALAADGKCCAEAARILGISKASLGRWSHRAGVVFPDGRGGARENLSGSPLFVAAARRNWAKARAASAAKKRLPLTPGERRRYDAYRSRCSTAGVSITRADAFRAIGRADLIPAGD